MRYRFGELELDVSSYTLSRAGQKVHVTPKVFDLLRHLIEQRDRVVTKDELLDALWADSTVNEGAIPWAISQARVAIGQSARDKLPIETHYGRGYRFVGEVEALEARATERPPASAASMARAPAAWLVPPFVGRSRAMGQLSARLSAAKSGRGGICTLTGPAGIGKTRCMEELTLLARAEGFDVWSGRSTEDAVAPVLWPWIQVLHELSRDRATLQPTVQELLASLAPGKADDADAEPRDTTPAGSFVLFEGVSRLLRDAAQQAPVLVLLDELHWADAGTTPRSKHRCSCCSTSCIGRTPAA